MPAEADEVISRSDLAALPEYSCSIPTGVTIGKRWRRDTHFGRDHINRARAESEWIICEYVEVPEPGMVGIRECWATDEQGEPHRGDPEKPLP